MNLRGPLLGVVLMLVDERSAEDEEVGVKGKGEETIVVATEEGIDVTNPAECVDETDVESSSEKLNPERFFEPLLETELGVLPGFNSSYTSSGQIKKNMRILTGDMTSKAAAIGFCAIAVLAPGRNKLGPNTVAKLLRVILLNSA